jgi:hypothetical protein
MLNEEQKEIVRFFGVEGHLCSANPEQRICPLFENRTYNCNANCVEDLTARFEAMNATDEEKPEPLFTATVECFGPEVKPEGWVYAKTSYGIDTIMWDSHKSEWLLLGGERSKLVPFSWFYPPKQPLECPKPWRPRVEGSMPSDFDFPEGLVMLWYNFGTAMNIVSKSNLQHYVDYRYWAPYGAEAPSIDALKEYIKAKEGKESDE